MSYPLATRPQGSSPRTRDTALFCSTLNIPNNRIADYPCQRRFEISEMSVAVAGLIATAVRAVKDALDAELVAINRCVRVWDRNHGGRYSSAIISPASTSPIMFGHIRWAFAAAAAAVRCAAYRSDHGRLPGLADRKPQLGGGVWGGEVFVEKESTVTHP